MPSSLRRFVPRALALGIVASVAGCELGASLDAYSAGGPPSGAAGSGAGAAATAAGGASGGAASAGFSATGGAGTGKGGAGAGGAAAGKAGSSGAGGGAKAGSSGAGGVAGKAGSSGALGGSGGAAAAGAAGSGAASGEGGFAGAPATCNGEPEGTSRCAPQGASADVQTCMSGKWVMTASCDPGFLCDSSKPHTTSTSPAKVLCVAVVPECVAHAGKIVCDPSGNLVMCGPDSVSKTTVAPCTPALCPSSLSLGGKSCVACVPGDLRCTASDLQQCDATGQWGKTTTCPLLQPCNAATLTCSGQTCSSPQKSCQGASVVTCDASGTSVGAACSMGCTNGACNTCSPGPATCSGNTVVSCQSGMQVMTACPAATPLCVGAGQCVECNTASDCPKATQCDSVSCSNNTCATAVGALGDTACGATHCCDSSFEVCSGGVCKVPACFAAGTKIAMADGTERAIEDVRVGDVVASFDLERGVVVERRVSKTFVHAEGELDEPMLLVDDRLLVTANHPFFIGGRWIRADAMAGGGEATELSAASASVRRTAIVSVVRVPGRPRTWNLEVEDTHVYFAGGLLVHNKIQP